MVTAKVNLTCVGDPWLASNSKSGPVYDCSKHQYQHYRQTMLQMSSPQGSGSVILYNSYTSTKHQHTDICYIN